MQNSKSTCSISVSDLAVCQKCPMLLAYKIHMGEKSAWRVGIQGNGNFYGSAFHRHISRVFFEAAAKPYHPLHDNIRHAVSGGEYELENLIREHIFFPFVERNSDRFSSGQIISMAKGVTVWVKAMSEFFSCIPSLTRYYDSESNMQLIFAKPEYKLSSEYRFDNAGTMYITGRYDALMFNPDRREMRLFEFKGYMKSDITIPLSQSLIYSWLIWKNTGMIPSIEIIYLDEEDKQPDIFDSKSVCNMMSPTLPELFYTAFSILTLRRKPEILRDKDLCTSCRYKDTCRRDMTKLFAKTRTGASLLNVLIFFLIALMITAQAFFFLENSAESISEEREMMQVRLKLDSSINEAKETLLDSFIKNAKGERPIEIVFNKTLPYIGLIDKDKHKSSYTIYKGTVNQKEYGKNFFVFYDARGNEKDENDSKTKLWERNYTDNSVAVFDLNYHFLFEDNDRQIELTGLVDVLNKQTAYDKIYPPLGKNYFLIRARQKLPTGNYIMRQAVVKVEEKENNTYEISETSSEEVFYW